MFETLSMLTAGATVPVVYKTIFQLFERRDVGRAESTIETEELAELTKQWDQLTDEQQQDIIDQISHLLIQEIELKEKTPVSSFSEDLVKKYTSELSLCVRDVATQEQKIDSARSQELIDQLRHDYP